MYSAKSNHLVLFTPGDGSVQSQFNSLSDARPRDAASPTPPPRPCVCCVVRMESARALSCSCPPRAVLCVCWWSPFFAAASDMARGGASPEGRDALGARPLPPPHRSSVTVCSRRSRARAFQAVVCVSVISVQCSSYVSLIMCKHGWRAVGAHALH